jgi:hypothetical protein
MMKNAKYQEHDQGRRQYHEENEKEEGRDS